MIVFLFIFELDQISDLKVWDLQVYLKLIYYLWFKGKRCRFSTMQMNGVWLPSLLPAPRAPRSFVGKSELDDLGARKEGGLALFVCLNCPQQSVKYPLSAIKLKQPLNTIMIVFDVSCIDRRQQLSYEIQRHISRMLHFTRYRSLFSSFKDI